jgi:hypothetical protein
MSEDNEDNVIQVVFPATRKPCKWCGLPVAIGKDAWERIQQEIADGLDGSVAHLSCEPGWG